MKNIANIQLGKSINKIKKMYLKIYMPLKLFEFEDQIILTFFDKFNPI